MAKPRKSKLVAVRQGHATVKGNSKKSKRIFKNATEKWPVVVVPTISQNFSIRSIDLIEEDASSPTIGSFGASHSRGSPVSRSQTSLFSTRRKKSGHISRKIRLLNKDLGSTSIYKLKKQPIGDPVEIQPAATDDAQNSSESKELEEEQSACDDDFDADSGAATSDLDVAKLESESDQDLKERWNLLNSLGDIPEWDGLSATTIISQSLAVEDSRTGVFRSALDATSSVYQLEEASLQSEQDYDFFSVGEHENSSKTDSEGPITHLSSASELESYDEADEVWRPQIKADSMPDITQVVYVNYVGRKSTLLFSQAIRSYLYELVDKVAVHSESAENQLKLKLDKDKLHQELCALVKDDLSERDKYDYLISRLTGHHLHRFRYSLIQQDGSSAANEMYHRRYQKALIELDSLLKKEQEAERIYLTERGRLEAELAEKQSQDEQKTNRLEDLIRETILPHTEMPQRLESVINTCLRQMRNKRNIISETRLDLINKQHLNSYIMQKVEEKEFIAEGLTLHTYEASIEEVNKLGRRLTIKTVELERLYKMFSNKVHTISHLRCQRRLLSRTFRVAKDELFQLVKKLTDLRAKVYQGHMRHNRLLAQIQEVRYKGGLMNYPLLLMDFDKTDQLVRDKRERVSLLRAQHDSLLGKIEQVELAVKRSVAKGLQEDLIRDK